MRSRALDLIKAVWKRVRQTAKVRERLRNASFPLRVLHVSGARRISASSEEFLVVCLVRDGAVYLQEFLRHYRELGARHIILLDNGSTDGTADLVADAPDVTVLRTLAPYKFYKDAMKRFLVTRFGRRNWVLCVDIDELFDYPFRSTMNTRRLLKYLNRSGYTAVTAQLLDLFPKGPIAGGVGSSWRLDHRFYDLSDLEKLDYNAVYAGQNQAPDVGLKVIYGGIRSSKFQVRPLLTKHPLLYPSRGIKYLHAHHVSGACVADISAVLLHYKYVGDFANYIKRIVKEESFSMGSREYKEYLRVIESDAGLELHTSQAREFSTVEDLIDQEFLVVSDAFRSEAAGPVRSSALS